MVSAVGQCWVYFKVCLFCIFTRIILLNVRWMHSSIHSFLHSYIHSSFHLSVHIHCTGCVCDVCPLYGSAMHLMHALALCAISSYLAEVVLRAFSVLVSFFLAILSTGHTCGLGRHNVDSAA